MNKIAHLMVISFTARFITKEVSLSLIIAGCMLLGLGIGMFFGEEGAGVITGIGLGLIGEFFFGSKLLSRFNRSE